MVPAWVNVKMLRRTGEIASLRGCEIFSCWVLLLQMWLHYACLVEVPFGMLQILILYHGSGCQLPVEMLFPAAEYPTPELVAALAQMGVTCRMLPDVVLQSSRKAKSPDSTAEMVVDPMSGFTMKIAAVILSSFQEVDCNV